jgi:hypothetical protein
MRKRVVFLGLISVVAVCGQSSSTAKAAASVDPALIPSVLHLCAQHCVTFTRENDQLTNYTIFPGQRNVKRVMVVERFTPESVVIRRTDTGSHPLTVVYSGRMSSDGNSLPGAGWKMTWGAALDSLPGSDEERDRRKAPAQTAAPSAKPSAPVLPGHEPAMQDFHLPSGKLNLSGQWESAKIGPDKKVYVELRIEIRQQDDRIEIVNRDVRTGFAGITVFKGKLQGSEIDGVGLELDSTPNNPRLTRQGGKIYVDDPDHIHIEEGTKIPSYRVTAHADDVACDSQNSSRTMAWFAYARGRDAMWGQKDYLKSACWFQIAAFQGVAGAQAMLASQFYHGQGVPVNYDQAFAWAQKSAAQQNLFGETVLANLYAEGKGVPADPGKAAYWRERIAAQKNALIWSHMNDKTPSGLTGWQALGMGLNFAMGMIKQIDDEGLRGDCAIGVRSACDALRAGH